MQIVPAAISSPARTTHQSAGSKRSLSRWPFDHDAKSRGVKSQCIGERLLVRGVELARVPLRVEGDDAQPVRPRGRGRRRLELDAHLAEDAHGAVAERLEQAAGGGVGLEDAVLDPACAVARRVLLEPGRDQPPDPAPVRVGVDVRLDAPALAPFAHHAVADDAVAVADDARVALEIELRPLALQVGLGERRAA